MPWLQGMAPGISNDEVSCSQEPPGMWGLREAQTLNQIPEQPFECQSCPTPRIPSPSSSPIHG